MTETPQHTETTDDEQTATTPGETPPTDAQVGQRPPPGQRAPDDGLDLDRSLREWLELATLGALVVLVAVAGVGLYGSVTTAISRLVAPSYEPLFEAVFHLVVLLLSAVALSVLLRRREAAST